MQRGFRSFNREKNQRPPFRILGDDLQRSISWRKGIWRYYQLSFQFYLGPAECFFSLSWDIYLYKSLTSQEINSVLNPNTLPKLQLPLNYPCNEERKHSFCIFCPLNESSLPFHQFKQNSNSMVLLGLTK